MNLWASPVGDGLRVSEALRFSDQPTSSYFVVVSKILILFPQKRQISLGSGVLGNSPFFHFDTVP